MNITIHCIVVIWVFLRCSRIFKLFLVAKLREDVKKHVNFCDVCQRSKIPTTQPVGLLQPLDILEKNGGCVSIDFIVGLTPTKHMMQFLCVLIN